MAKPLLILDLSSNNAQPWDLAKAKAAGYTGVIIKVTEGTGYVNPYFAAAWVQAKNLGMWRALYHFNQLGVNTPEAEAAWLLRNIPGDFTYGDGIVFDVEAGGNVNLGDEAYRFGKAVQDKVGFAPILYSFVYFIAQYLQDPRLTVFPLWLADWGSFLPASLAPWPVIAMWQFTENGTVPGIPGEVDISSVARDLAGLQALGKPRPTPAPNSTWKSKRQFGLLPQPIHFTKSLATVPAGGTGLIEAGTSVDTKGEVWQAVQFRDQHGWTLKDYLTIVHAA